MRSSVCAIPNGSDGRRSFAVGLGQRPHTVSALQLPPDLYAPASPPRAMHCSRRSTTGCRSSCPGTRKVFGWTRRWRILNCWGACSGPMSPARWTPTRFLPWSIPSGTTGRMLRPGRIPLTGKQRRQHRRVRTVTDSGQFSGSEIGLRGTMTGRSSLSWAAVRAGWATVSRDGWLSSRFPCGCAGGGIGIRVHGGTGTVEWRRRFPA